MMARTIISSRERPFGGLQGPDSGKPILVVD